MSRSRATNPETAQQLRMFQRYRPGQSFFVAGAELKDLEYLRQPAIRRGLGISIRHFEKDPIYFEPGVRVYREEGPYDDM